MDKLAVIKTGGKQYLVKPGDKLKVEKLPQDEGKSFNFDKILLLVDGKELKIGCPYLKNAKVKAKVLTQGRARKIKVTHYKPKTRYYKTYGHRQPYTQVKILSCELIPDNKKA